MTNIQWTPGTQIQCNNIAGLSLVFTQKNSSLKKSKWAKRVDFGDFILIMIYMMGKDAHSDLLKHHQNHKIFAF